MGDAVARLVLTPPKPRRKPAASRSSAKAMHKRTRSGATTATITLRPDGSLVLVVDDVLTKNDRYRLVKVGKRAAQAESVLAKKYKAAVKFAAVTAEAHGLSASRVYASAGLWRLEVISVWPKQRKHKDGTRTAFGDSDAPIAMVKDALQHAGVIDDDMRIVGETTHAVYRKGVRATVAVLRPVCAEEHAAGCEPMLRLLGLPC